MARILIIRFSALGDVAMTIPVIHSLAVQYPQHEITVLSRAVWQPLFQGLPANVGFVGADLTGKHKGLWGLNSLYSELCSRRSMTIRRVPYLGNALETAAALRRPYWNA